MVTQYLLKNFLNSFWFYWSWGELVRI